MSHHFVPVSYTNIYLMKTVNIMLIGKALSDTAWMNLGKQMLDTMVAYTSKAGIHEFDSPTYYATDLESLYIGYALSNDLATRQKLKILLDTFWNDIAANTMQTGKLCGAFSRDYDFLFGTGGLMYYQYVEGLRDLTIAPLVNDEMVLLLAGGYSDSGYIPDQSVLAANTIPERIVLSRFDTASRNDRYSYISPYFSLGCPGSSETPGIFS